MNDLQVPLIVHCPALPQNGRTVVHGHLFVHGILLNESGMEKHPLNPMNDASLPRLLSAQTPGAVGCINLTTLRQGVEAVTYALAQLQAEGTRHVIVDTLDEALAGCSLVVGTSARSRTLPWPMLDPRECGLKSVAEAANTPVALVFGRERVGLTNEELQKCHYHVAIAANPEYSSLNLAMAVQVIAYEVRMAWLATQEKSVEQKEETAYPLVDDLERFYGHLEQTLLSTGFIREGHPGQVMNKLRRMFTRARPESQELNILRGILASIEQKNKEE